MNEKQHLNTRWRYIHTSEAYFQAIYKFPKSFYFKQGSRSLCNNYSPMSVLSALSKILRIRILNQLLFHFTTGNIPVPNQFGFRAGKTTTDHLVELTATLMKVVMMRLY